ncbi:glycerate kinase type-2 family protein [Anaerocolumna sp. MB42-C2]|uniref:glycerate kinase type-2 family protein n=1 Tax=Anaerocolumna sp. MB42-C2 TaxID=3070997 RepID=UPI0027DF7BE8|nr:glycerate kinase [Anaerocolumna sp. MB42-C2]WMJ86257.1 glycerate kinase [Anaerocolumna sp. MB42-C2]
MIHEDASIIIRNSISDVLPDKAVTAVLKNKKFLNKVYVVAVGKAAWIMAETAGKILGNQIQKGLIITKYGYSKGDLEGFEILEAGHPVPDNNSLLGTQKAIDMVKGLSKEDEVLFLLSGGGSSLFEMPVQGITLEDIQEVTRKLLSCGADITEINTIRKRLSSVKGGKFAKYCEPARVCSILLSDVIKGKADMIASGPAYPDVSASTDVYGILIKYDLILEDHMIEAIKREIPQEINNVETYVTGSVRDFCEAVAKYAQQLGYKPYIISTTLDCEAREAGKFMASIARRMKEDGNYRIKPPCAIIAGGETVVKVEGEGLGGRNQEIALSAAIGIKDMNDVVIFSVSSDGTDGPTDADGGIVDGNTVNILENIGIDCTRYLKNNDSYHALEKAGALVFTGSTGTNVNDVTVILCR